MTSDQLKKPVPGSLDRRVRPLEVSMSITVPEHIIRGDPVECKRLSDEAWNVAHHLFDQVSPEGPQQLTEMLPSGIQAQACQSPKSL